MGLIRATIARHQAISGRATLGGVAVHTMRQPIGYRWGHGARSPLGDPGFFGKLIGGIDKAVTGIVKSIPGGNAAVGITDAIGGFIKKHPKGTAAAAGLAGAAGGAGLAGLLGKLGGKGSRGAGGHRKYRRMNPLNYRALKRSTRRIHAASKIMRTVFAQAKHVRVPKHTPRGVRGYHRKAA